MPSPVLSDAIFWGATAVCAVAQVAVLRAALAGRTPAATSNWGAQVRELFWVFLPAVFLGTLLVWTWRSLPARESTRPTAAVVEYAPTAARGDGT